MKGGSAVYMLKSRNGRNQDWAINKMNRRPGHAPGNSIGRSGQPPRCRLLSTTVDKAVDIRLGGGRGRG